jgi:hypothetical protein
MSFIAQPQTKPYRSFTSIGSIFYLSFIIVITKSIILYTSTNTNIILNTQTNTHAYIHTHGDMSFIAQPQTKPYRIHRVKFYSMLVIAE